MSTDFETKGKSRSPERTLAAVTARFRRRRVDESGYAGLAAPLRTTATA